MVLIFWSGSSSFQVFLCCLAFRPTGFSFGALTMAGWPLTLAASFLAMSSVADSASCFYCSPFSTLTASKCPETTASSKLKKPSWSIYGSVTKASRFLHRLAENWGWVGSFLGFSQNLKTRGPSSSRSGALWPILRMILLEAAVLFLLCTGLGKVGN